MLRLLVLGGQTSHSRFKIPLNIHENSSCYVSKNLELADLLRETTFFIWDEVPMQHQYYFQSVDKLLKDIRSNERLFGGLPVVMGGDFAQILPVVRRGTRASTVAASIQKLNIWSQLRILFLTPNMRLSSEESGVFAKWLKEMPYDLCWRDRIELPLFLSRTETMDEFCEAVFPSAGLQNSAQNATFFRNRAILTFCNNVVADFNQKILHKLP